MNINRLLFTFVIISLIIPFTYSTPNMNGTSGCSGSGCHTYQTGIVSVTMLSNLQVRVTVSGTTSKVAGELVNSSGSVVAVINSTSTNPFTLTAPSAGTYKVNAGYKSPSRRWDSTSIVIALTDVRNNLMEGTPHSYVLHNNFPNPFNPSTQISFSIPERSIVSLKIYDLIGNEIVSPINEEKESGSYSYTFKANNFSSGTYFYRMEAVSVSNSRRGFRETKKMLLTK